VSKRRKLEEFGEILYRVEGKIARVSLARPKKRNALSLRMRGELVSALREAEDDEAVSVILIDGQGPSFCAGYDLAEGLDAHRPRKAGEAAHESPDSDDWVKDKNLAPWIDPFARSCLRDWTTLWDLLKPVVAMVHGDCLAGGLELMSMADIAFATDDARLGYPPMRGIATPDVPFFPWKMSMARAKYLQLTGNSLSGKEAAEWGWIAKSFSPDVFEASVLNEVQALSEIAVDLLAANKQQLNQAYEFMGMKTHFSQAWSWHLLSSAVRPNYKGFFRVARDQGLKAAFDWMNKPFKDRGIK
jgi:enoyl-CoA hydratase